MKVVLDTNVILSGLMSPSSIPGRILSAWYDASFDVAISTDQLTEIGRVLACPKIHRKLHWDSHRIEQFIQQLYLRCEVADIRGITADVPQDRNDEPILATLISAGADLLISGDADLLALREQFPIETPAEFFSRLIQEGWRG